MKTRKLILLAADILLLVIMILQITLKSGDKVKVFSLSEDPDEIVVSTPSENYSIIRMGDNWFVGDKKYPANESYVNSYIEATKNIKVLDKVTSNSSENVLSRYDLNKGQAVSVIVKKGGEVLRTILVGKNATAGSQTYVKLDDDNGIYLATGNLRNDFEKTVSYLRSRIVFDFNKDEVNSVAITDKTGKTWSISRMGSGTDVAWNCTGAIVDVDGAKALPWLESFANTYTPAWYDENYNAGGTKIASAKIGVGFKTVTMEVYEVPAETEDGKTTYWGTCSETPYPFELANYAIQKFISLPEDFAK